MDLLTSRMLIMEIMILSVSTTYSETDFAPLNKKLFGRNNFLLFNKATILLIPMLINSNNSKNELMMEMSSPQISLPKFLSKDYALNMLLMSKQQNQQTYLPLLLQHADGKQADLWPPTPALILIKPLNNLLNKLLS